MGLSLGTVSRLSGVRHGGCLSELRRAPSLVIGISTTRTWPCMLADVCASSHSVPFGYRRDSANRRRPVVVSSIRVLLVLHSICEGETWCSATLMVRSMRFRLTRMVAGGTAGDGSSGMCGTWDGGAAAKKKH